MSSAATEPKTCNQCKQVIQGGKCVQAMGVNWHEDHFVCKDCKTKLIGTQFMDLGGVPHCQKCYIAKHADRCKGCSKPIADKAIVALDAKWHQMCFRCSVSKSKQGSVNGDVVTARSPDIPPRSADTSRGPEQARIAQLEQNIRFLQEQHQLMLNGLHNEIENLKTRNRELQFQLVFAKGASPSSPSSPEDDTKHKVYSSPKSFNVTPLQVEILEKELGELKLQSQETESRNVYLSAIVDEQKKKLERYERDREKECERAAQPDPELLRKLDDAEAIIRRLRRENSDLRRENGSHYSPREGAYQQRIGENGFTPRSGQHSGRGNGVRHRGNNGHYRGNWFPPLHSQSYWQGGRGHERNNLPPAEGSNALPSLHTNENQYHGRRGSNNNHYQNGEGRKYRGSQKNAKPA